MPYPLPGIPPVLPRRDIDSMSLPHRARMVYGLFLFEHDRWTLDHLARTFRQRGVHDLTVAECDRMCALLAAQGLLSPVRPLQQALPSRTYDLAARPPLAAARDLLRDAVAGGWSPQGESARRTPDRYRYSGQDEPASPASTRLLLAFLAGGSGPDALPAAGDEMDIWMAAIRFADFLEGESAMADFAFPSGTASEIYRILAAVLFTRGLPVATLLPDWAAKWRGTERWHLPEPSEFEYRYSRSGKTKPGEFRSGLGRDEFSAYCMWTGRTDLLDAPGKAPAGPDEAWAFTSACRNLAAGRDGGIRGQLDLFRPRVQSPPYDAERLVLAMPASLLFLMAHMAFRPNPPMTYLGRLAEIVHSDSSSLRNGFPASCHPFIQRRHRETGEFRLLLGGYPVPGPAPAASPHAWDSPACGLGAALAAAAGTLAEDDLAEAAPRALRLAGRAAALGYPTLAAVHLAAFGWHFRGADAEAAAALAARLGPAAYWFRPYEGPGGAWRRVVEAFDRALPAAPKAKTVSKSGRILWEMWLRPVYNSGGSGFFRCIDVSPSYRGPRGSSDGRSDRPLTVRSATSARYAPLLTKDDRAILAALPSTDAWHRPEPSPDLLALLCGNPSLTAHPEGWSHARPATLARRDLPLAIESLPDGGIALSVPPWCLEIDTDIAIRADGPDDYSLYAFPPAVRATLRVIDLCGTGGRVEIPKAGMDAFKPLLPRLATLAPVQGDLAAMSDAADLPRIQGDPTPLVRLRYDPGAPLLALTLHVRPLDGDPALLLPGAGQPERLVGRQGRSAVLVRDLDAEKKGAADVRTALADCESWALSPTEWAIDDLPAMLGALDALRALGDRLRLEWLSPEKLAVTAPVPSSWRVTAAGGADRWFTVKGTFALDDGRAATLSALIDAWQRRTGEYVPFGDDAYIRLTAALARRLEALAAAARPAPGKDGALAVPPAALPMLDAAFDPGADRAAGLALPKTLADRAAAIRDAFAAPVRVPARLTAVLRPYQHDGYLWLSRLAAAGLGSCLADDMGLGKTLQLIALLLARAADGPSLVVAPASVCGNWRGELRRFAPTLRPIMAWDADADATDAALAAAGPGDIVIAGYSPLAARRDAFAARPWNGVVLDEAQAIKNEDTLRARAVRRLSARFRCAATGTPVENRLADIWSLFEFLNPGLLGTPADFARRFAADGRPAPALTRLPAPLILRRRQRDVLDDLPAKTEITLPVLLSDGERAGYETLRRRALENLDRTGGKTNRISILAELTRLRRYCCHPSLVLGPGSGIPSAKLDTLLRLLSTLRENRHRALVFSQFTDCLAIVRRALDGAGHTHLYLDGQTPSADRARLVDAFQRGEGDFFLISLKAGGLGLNLTAADYVILLDPWWNPAVENQAADRAHRIGQTNPVTVYRLIASDTVEERVLALHAEKRALSADLLDAASSAPDLTPDLLLSLFQ